MAKILVVEDEKNLRLLYKHDLEEEGHTVIAAANAIEGLEALEQQVPDLVVLDIRMPGMDGLEAMGRILDRNPRIPVILNSAYSSYKDNFMSWAADAYIIKSADTSQLRNKVREILEARRSENAEGGPTGAGSR
jgi:CheY-like chemotaxis protein